MSKKRKKIAICHYRVGGTDGVSLEIEKRKEILERYGCEVKLIAGPQGKGADYIIKELEWDRGIIPIIKENGFLHFDEHSLNDNELKKKINEISRIIEGRLNAIQIKERFDYILIHNVFSFGGHIAAAKAFAKWVKEFNTPCLATHHDFYWERKEFRIPRNQFLISYMDKYMPPRYPIIEHVVINSIAQHEVKKLKGIESEIMPDVFDFKQKEWKKDKFNSDFLEQFNIRKDDIVILQATRIIPRKGIEVAIDFVKELQKHKEKLINLKLYNGKKITAKSNFVLLLAGYAEDEKRDYLFKLKSKAFDAGVRAVFVSNHVRAKRKYSHGMKLYSLWDAYAYADIVTFPSVWEGWGNQFIEAVFARKPVILFEYPVYKHDIQKEGYNVISLGDQFKMDKDENLVSVPRDQLKHSVKKSLKWLMDKNLHNRLDKNFEIGEKFHGYQVLEKFLIKKLNLK